MNKEELEAVEFWKDCIKHLEKEFQYPNYLGYFITIRDKECEYLKTTLNLIDKLQQKVKQLEKENQELREKIIDKKYEILEFIKENKVKRYRVLKKSW